MKARHIVEIMDKWALPQLIEDWDNTGFQIGDGDKDISKILLALDLDYTVYEKAVKEDFHMIITHHPIIFQPLKSITTFNYKEKLVYNLIKNDIAVYNAHTNLDQTINGVSHELAKLLGLRNTITLKTNEKGLDISYGYGRIGDIEEMELIDLANLIKENLNIDHIVIYGDIEKRVKKVSLCGGNGADFIYDAYEQNSDVYITGDIKYHDAQYGNELGLTIIDAGHYHTEKVILPVIKDYLKSNMKENLYIEIWDKPTPNYGIF